MTFSEIRRLLNAYDLRLTKSLGQNFMHDRNQLTRLVNAAELLPTDSVLEVGPGLGPLTEHLLPHCRQLLILEKDRRFREILQDRLGSPDNLTVEYRDALHFLKQAHAEDWSDWKMVSNLPYSVASPILVELAQMPLPPKRIVATLQWEVAQRLQAKPNTKDYGLLTLLVQARYRLIQSFKVPAGCFFPEPDVESACVRLDLRSPSVVELSELPSFTQIVRRAFSQRRKTMLKLLKEDWPGDQLEAAFSQLTLSRQARAESLSLDQFVALTRALDYSSRA